MASNDSTDGRPPGNGDSDEPIAELRELFVEPSRTFASRLRRRIERRETTQHVLLVAWRVPVAVFMSFLEMIFSLFGSGPSDGGGSR